MTKRYWISSIIATVITLVALNGCAGLTKQQDSWFRSVQQFGIEATNVRSDILTAAGNVYKGQAKRCTAQATSTIDGRLNASMLQECMRTANLRRGQIETAGTIYAHAVQQVLEAESLEDVLKKIPEVRDAAAIFSNTVGDDLITFTEDEVRKMLVAPVKKLEGVQ